MPLIVAWRYARSSRREASVRFLSSVTVWGVALGVAALVLAVSALSGFQATLLEEVLARSPRLQVRLAPGQDAAEVAALVASVEGVESAQTVVAASGWLVDEGRVTPCDFLAFEREIPVWFPGQAGARAAGLVLPHVLASRWGITVGERVRVVSPRPTLTPMSRQIPRSRQIEVTGIYDAGRSQDHEGRVALALADGERLFWPSDRRLDVGVSLARVAEVAAALGEVLPEGAEVLTYRDLNRALFFALRLEKALMFVGVFLIVLVASQTLVSSLALVIASKRREMGVLGALGLGPRGLYRLIVLLAAVLAGSGLVLGGAFGSAAAWALDRYHLIRLPADVYIVDYVPFLLRPVRDLALIFGATALLAWMAARAAGRRASRLDAAEALRR